MELFDAVSSDETGNWIDLTNNCNLLLLLHLVQLRRGLINYIAIDSQPLCIKTDEIWRLYSRSTLTKS